MTFRNSKTIDKQITDAMNKGVKQAINSEINIDFIEKQKDLIVKRTRLGNGIDPQTGNTTKLPPLSENYKEQRQGKARWFTTKEGKRVKVTKAMDKSGKFVKKPRLAATTQPAKSNVTATGQLLKSLSVARVKTSSALILKILVGDRRGRGLFGYPSNIGNKELIRLLAAQGRVFLGFTKSQTNQIRREIRQKIIKFLR